jgi:hypothetical protein
VIRVSDADFNALRQAVDREPSRETVAPFWDPIDGRPLHDFCDLDLGAHTVRIESWN